MRHGLSDDAIAAVTRFDPWFLARIREIVETEDRVRRDGLPVTEDGMRALKMMGFTDARLAKLTGREESNIRRARLNLGVTAAVQAHRHLRRRVRGADALHVLDLRAPHDGRARMRGAASAREEGRHPRRRPQPHRPGDRVRLLLLPRLFRAVDAGYETIMVNCNPETVSTDYDTSDRLYFEPLTFEHVMEILRVEQENGTLHGVIVQFGGQTPLKLANALHDAGIPILGTTPDAIDLAEDRERFQQLVQQARPEAAEQRHRHHRRAGQGGAERARLPAGDPPLLRAGRPRDGDRPRHRAQLDRYIRDAVVVSGDSPVLLDSYLDGAVEVDVDALCDGEAVHVAGIMQHIEEAGVHSGDSACSLPPHTLSTAIQDEIIRQTEALAQGAQRRGPDERAVRGEGRRDLPDRGEPPRLAHRALRGQGDRQRHRLHRRAAHGRREALRLPRAPRNTRPWMTTPRSSPATRCRSPISASRGSR
jgi:carbamoyl-phosphate synthase large subunit